MRRSCRLLAVGFWWGAAVYAQDGYDTASGSPLPRGEAILPAPRIEPVPGQPGKGDHGPGFQWGSALRDSSRFLACMHAFRLATEQGTRRELRGPFWRDYGRAVKGLSGWGDGDDFLTNYIGHPFQGAVTGYIQIRNDPAYRRAEFGWNESYLRSRLRATLYSTAFSTFFELSPLGEPGLGNVGKIPGTAGTVDLVMTPVGGLGIMMAEDAIDRFVVKRVERATRNRLLRMLARACLNPNRSFANAMSLRLPWHRETREGIWRR